MRMRRRTIAHDGKVQNLRLAARRIDGAFVPAGSTSASGSKSVARRGAAATSTAGVGEGCVIQASGRPVSAFQRAARRGASAGFEIVERHAHSAVVAGSFASVAATRPCSELHRPAVPPDARRSPRGLDRDRRARRALLGNGDAPRARSLMRRLRRRNRTWRLPAIVRAAPWTGVSACGAAQRASSVAERRFCWMDGGRSSTRICRPSRGARYAVRAARCRRRGSRSTVELTAVDDVCESLALTTLRGGSLTRVARQARRGSGCC